MQTDKSNGEFWGLNEQVRFPPARESWEKIDQLPVSLPRPATDRVYSDAIGSGFRNRTLREVAELLHTRRDDFVNATAGIRPEAWRLLYYRGTFLMQALTAEKFHAELSLRRRCSPVIDHDDPPEEWLGSNRPPQVIAEELEIALRHLGNGPANAAWVILSLAQGVGLTKAEVLRCPWWDHGWIKGFTEKVFFVS